MKPEYLYQRGFLLTDAEVPDSEWISQWKRCQIGRYTFFVSPCQKLSVKKNADRVLALAGHAYDPFAEISDEGTVLEHLLAALEAGKKKEFWNLFHQLTGVFTLLYFHGDTVYLAGDPCCMQSTFYFCKKNFLAIGSHTNMIGSLFDFKWDPYIKQLTDYRFFPLLGNSLPGDLTQFAEVRRLVPNHYVIFRSGRVSVRRFFTPSVQKLTDSEIVEQVSALLHRNMKLISEKWERPAISLTGGCDSKTTLACTKGLYDKFQYFSYVSSEAERADADAAHKICESMGLPHRIYQIPGQDDCFEDLEDVRETLFVNTGSIRKNNPNDVRKRAYFEQIGDFDVEVKSWASEIGRAYYSKRFHGKKDFGTEPAPRKCTTLYKFFFHNRDLVRKTDRVFEKYLHKYFKQDALAPLPWQEQFFWEFRVPSWNGVMLTGEHRYSYEVTIPYNNRRILELLLSTSLDNRLNDTLYKEIRKRMAPEVDGAGISVRNIHHTEARERMEEIYYLLHTSFPL